MQNRASGRSNSRAIHVIVSWHQRQHLKTIRFYAEMCMAFASFHFTTHFHRRNVSNPVSLFVPLLVNGIIQSTVCWIEEYSKHHEPMKVLPPLFIRIYPKGTLCPSQARRSAARFRPSARPRPLRMCWFGTSPA